VPNLSLRMFVFGPNGDHRGEEGRVAVRPKEERTGNRASSSMCIQPEAPKGTRNPGGLQMPLLPSFVREKIEESPRKKTKLYHN